MDLVLPTLEINVGEDFELNLEFINRSDQRRVVDTYISGSVVYYTGVTSSEFLFRDPTVTIGPNKSEYGVDTTTDKIICIIKNMLGLLEIIRHKQNHYNLKQESTQKNSALHLKNLESALDYIKKKKK